MVHRSTIGALRAIVGRAEFIYVADCKLCTVDNLRHLARYGGQFVTVIPRTWKEDQQFRTRLRERGIRWHLILRMRNHRHKDGPPDVYSSCQRMSWTEPGLDIGISVARPNGCGANECHPRAQTHDPTMPVNSRLENHNFEAAVPRTEHEGVVRPGQSGTIQARHVPARPMATRTSFNRAPTRRWPRPARDILQR